MLIFAIQKNQIQNSKNQTTIEQIDDAFGVNLLYLRHKQKQSQPLQRDTRPIYIHLTMMKFILTDHVINWRRRIDADFLLCFTTQTKSTTAAFDVKLFALMAKNKTTNDYQVCLTNWWHIDINFLLYFTT